MIRTQIYLPKRLYKMIDLLAKREKKPKAQVIRDVLEKGIKKKRGKETIGEALLKLAQLGKKVGASGHTDLSVNHDKYLYEDE